MSLPVVTGVGGAADLVSTAAEANILLFEPNVPLSLSAEEVVASAALRFRVVGEMMAAGRPWTLRRDSN